MLYVLYSRNVRDGRSGYAGRFKNIRTARRRAARLREKGCEVEIRKVAVKRERRVDA